MDILAWLGSVLVAALGLIWWLVWFLIGGWVSTLLQIVVLVGVVYILRFGWRRGPLEFGLGVRSLASFAFNWLRGKDMGSTPRREVREVIRVVKVKEMGDVNLSTLLSLLMLGGLVLLGYT